MKFPIINGSNLQRKKLKLPEYFQGKFNLVFIAFQQWQQSQVDSWLPFAQQLENTYDGLYYYELPTIRRLNLFSRTFINEGMRAGIPNPKARERTITLYVDKHEFFTALGLPGEDSIAIFARDQQDNIIWRAYGIFRPETGESLEAILHEVQVENN